MVRLCSPVSTKWILLKESSGSDAWMIWDNARNKITITGKQLYLQPQATTTEGDADLIDFLSNGFKLRTTTGSMNQSGQTYIYAAFASITPQKFRRACAMKILTIALAANVLALNVWTVFESHA